MTIKRKIILWMNVEFEEEELIEEGFDPNNEDDVYRFLDGYVTDIFFDRDYDLFKLKIRPLDNQEIDKYYLIKFTKSDFTVLIKTYMDKKSLEQQINRILHKVTWDGYYDKEDIIRVINNAYEEEIVNYEVLEFPY